MNPLVSVVIIVRNMPDTIGDCLESLLDQTVPKDKYEIIVVDNNSTDNTREIVRKYPVKLVSEEKVGNFGGARNMGITNSKGEIVAFIDADCIAEKDWIQKMLTLHSSFPRIAGHGGSNSNPYPENKVARTIACAQNGDWSPDAPRRVADFLPGCNCSYRKEVLLQVGMFPEGTASEDILIGAKIRRTGQLLLFDPVLIVEHDFDRTLNKLAQKEERCGRGHFNMHSSYERASRMRLLALTLFSPLFILGRSARGFQRIMLYSKRKQDVFILLPYILYSGVYWTKGYLTQASVRGRERKLA